jgi:hypothetical protein
VERTPVRSAGLGFKDTRTALVIVFENLEDLMTVDEVLESSLEKTGATALAASDISSAIPVVIGV